MRKPINYNENYQKMYRERYAINRWINTKWNRKRNVSLYIKKYARRDHLKRMMSKWYVWPCVCDNRIRKRWQINECVNCGGSIWRRKQYRSKDHIKIFEYNYWIIRECQLCWDKKWPFHIHHIDKDKENNNIQNLIKLCIDCHREQHKWEIAYNIL